MNTIIKINNYKINYILTNQIDDNKVHILLDINNSQTDCEIYIIKYDLKLHKYYVQSLFFNHILTINENSTWDKKIDIINDINKEQNFDSIFDIDLNSNFKLIEIDANLDSLSYIIENKDKLIK